MDDVVTCGNCDQKNRVPDLPPGKVAICGRCKEPLSDDDDEADALDIEAGQS